MAALCSVRGPSDSGRRAPDPSTLRGCRAQLGPHSHGHVPPELLVARTVVRGGPRAVGSMRSPAVKQQ